MKMLHSKPRCALARLLSILAMAVSLASGQSSLHAQTFGLAEEIWTGLSGDYQYPQGASFTNSPANTNKTLTSFSVLNVGTNYGERLRAFVLPPISGRYTFSIASADWSDLYLSADETPENRVRIAYVSGASAQKDYGFQANQTSVSIPLEAGQRYYIEALHRESTNKGYLDVRWQLPDDTIEDPIVARLQGKPERLIIYRTNVVVAPVVLRQTTNQTVLEGRPVTFSVIASNLSPVSYQWQMDGADVPGATKSVYTLAAAHQAQHGGHKFRCVLSNSVSQINGADIGLAVTPDTVPPTLQTASPIGRTGLLLSFSEALDAASAGNKANYAIDGVQILSAQAVANPRQSLLITEPMAFGSSHTLKVSGVLDLGGVAILDGTQAAFSVQDSYLSTVGSTNSLGSSVPAGNGYDLTAGGRDLVGKPDQFAYQWAVVGGNFDVEVRVDSLDLTDLLAKAGLMAREDLGDTSRFAGAFTTPSLNGAVFQSRSTPGQAPTLSGNYPATLPNMWLRLQREGNIFRGFASSDASNWTPLGSALVTMPEYVYLGLAASARSTNATTVAKFRDYASIAGAPLGRPGLVDREPPGPSSRRTGLVISEIMYNPRPRADGKDLEFVEIFNAQPFFEDMSGYRLAGDIDFTFPANTILPGGAYMVIAKSPKDMESVYALRGVYGPYSNSIPNTIGTVQLINELGGIFLEVQFGTDMPWPISADGAGHSIVLAHPSYGEGSVKAWEASDAIDGSPGRFDALGAEPLRGVLINEFMANPGADQTEFVEVYNHTDQPIDVTGAWITDSPITNKFRIPPGSVIPAHGFLSFTGLQLGFGISSGGESLYLVNPAETRVVDAIRFGGSARGVSQGRTPDGSPALSELATPTPATANAARLMRDVVINEIMYAPISGDNDDEFVELYNRGAKPVDVGGWKLRDAVTFTFPSNTVIAANGYVVIGKNLARLLANYTNLTTANTFGNYNGTLANSGDHVALTMPETVISTNAARKVSTNIVHVVVNEVTYDTGGRWGHWAAGGGSSLELIDSDADNRQAANWADSDETRKAPWTPIEFTGRLDLGGMGDAAMLQLFLQGAGEALIDDLEVFTAANPRNAISNSGFEQGVAGWTFQGTHELSSLETTEGYNSGQSLRIRASGRGDNGGNRVRVSWTAPLPENSIGTIRAKVRWLTGTPQILLRLRGNWLECPGVMTLPKNLGTPGARNSRAIDNAGPALFEVTHRPVLPAAKQPITVTAKASDPDGIGGLSIFWRLDNAPAAGYSEIPMRDDGTGGDLIPGDGIYAGQIPGQGNNAMIAFYVAAKDGAAIPATARFPIDAPSHECLIHVGESQPTSAIGSYRFWCTQATVNRWNARGQQSNHPLDCTFAYNNYRVVYNAGTLYSGSPWHTPGYSGPLGSVCDYILHTPPDDSILGATDFVLASIGNTDNDDSKLAEQSSYWIARKMGLPYNYRRHIFLYFNGSRRASTVYEDTQQPNGDMLNEYYANDSSGPLHKIEDWFEFDDAGDTKQGNVDATLAPFLTLEGKKVARYRVCWRPRSLGSTGNPNDFSELFKIVDALGAQAPEPYNTALESIIDVERWLGIFAMEHIVGNWDSYGFARGKNMYAYKPTQGRWGLLLWDIDFDLNSASGSSRAPDGDMFEQNDAVIGRLYTMPLFRRIYFRICKEAAEGPLRDDAFAALLDAKFKGLVDNGAAPGSTAFMKDFVRARRDNLLKTVIPGTNFVTIGTNF
ncbi:MAG: lamin tail domain-containing protein, partial [Verrucomicrobia bacterium]|nr:lamin tail domain-containing protein [Verrucomicrobiota bacterium]